MFFLISVTTLSNSARTKSSQLHKRVMYVCNRHSYSQFYTTNMPAFAQAKAQSTINPSAILSLNSLRSPYRVVLCLEKGKWGMAYQVPDCLMGITRYQREKNIRVRARLPVGRVSTASKSEQKREEARGKPKAISNQYPASRPENAGSAGRCICMPGCVCV
ncbi:hypothetical protein BCR34DRAFT_92269 [Clohesyomyces aquaticus]|uniref:Uncharacterized protein n=1 Tax=Clohesyomyces aquaticus TaxID=1231657 RepID=A0A1Y1YU60_9PLEO|nr:hypothetical protein BCR34DRAFT_92269 [Clohesyomyces aquaticus]